jgi:transcriptional regulator with XRE-family HTH domain
VKKAKLIQGQEAAQSESAARALISIGECIRERRKGRKMTLQQLAEASGLSPSMLSLVERGRASPSIGSLLVISETLGVSMSKLVDSKPHSHDMIVRAKKSQAIISAKNVVRRILTEDIKQGVTVAINSYAPNTSSNETPIRHYGFEYGLLLEGKLTIEVDGVSHVLSKGDFISYSSRLPHKIMNVSNMMARTIWFNIGE